MRHYFPARSTRERLSALRQQHGITWTARISPPSCGARPSCLIYHPCVSEKFVSRVELSSSPFQTQKVLVSHGDAARAPRPRPRLGREVAEEGWSVAGAANYFRVSNPAAATWAERFVELGPEGMAARPCRPHSHPNRRPSHLVKKIDNLRIKKRLSPVQTAGRLRNPASTVHAVLRRCWLNRLSQVNYR